MNNDAPRQPLVELRNGAVVSVPQAETIARLLNGEGGDGHWHMNDCGCCATVHRPDGGYVVGRDGEYDYYPDGGDDE